MRTVFAMAALAACAFAAAPKKPAHNVFRSSLDNFAAFKKYQKDVRTHLGGSNNLKDKSHAAVRKYFKKKEDVVAKGKALKNAIKLAGIRSVAWKRAKKNETAAGVRLGEFAGFLSKANAAHKLMKSRSRSAAGAAKKGVANAKGEQSKFVAFFNRRIKRTAAAMKLA